MHSHGALVLLIVIFSYLCFSFLFPHFDLSLSLVGYPFYPRFNSRFTVSSLIYLFFPFLHLFSLFPWAFNLIRYPLHPRFNSVSLYPSLYLFLHCIHRFIFSSSSSCPSVSSSLIFLFFLGGLFIRYPLYPRFNSRFMLSFVLSIFFFSSFFPSVSKFSLFSLRLLSVILLFPVSVHPLSILDRYVFIFFLFIFSFRFFISSLFSLIRSAPLFPL